MAGTTAVAVIESGAAEINSVQDALDMMMAAKYETGAACLAIQKEVLAEEFFILSSGLAREILQKFVNYGVRCAIYGDYSRYTSKPLKDFIRESNRCGTEVVFVDTRENAVKHFG